ncbi:ABC transporter permease [Candidatus Magnetominusculus dajiuhuensis]|uniref:ABC transporter permease n=1 Tax=Candidatus Magnetominusculus dajiuhuensis TaxID=3137712 RepID=UPI003B42C1B4
MIISLLDISLQQCFLYSIAVYGIVVSFRMMNFPDLTVDGSFTLGGAVLSSMITANYPPLIALPLVAVAGFAAGSATVFLNRKLGISKILSGILIMMVLYSINLRIMGKANISLLRLPTLFSAYDTDDALKVLIFGGISVVFLICLAYLSMTRLGLFIRATGDNEFMVQTQGVNTDWLFYTGIGVSNALVALSGAFVVQNQGFADVNMGIGLIITALAALIIGESFIAALVSIKKFVFSKKTIDIFSNTKISLLPWSTISELFSALTGAFLYFLIISICLRLGLAPTDLKLATGILVILGISVRLRGPMVETYVRGRL